MNPLEYRKITFKGNDSPEDLYFIGDDLDGGAISTKYEYQNGLMGYGCFVPGEGVFRFGKRVALPSETWVSLETYEMEMSPHAMAEILARAAEELRNLDDTPWTH